MDYIMYGTHLVMHFTMLIDSTVRPLLYAVLGRTKFWSRKPRIIEVRIIDA